MNNLISLGSYRAIKKCKTLFISYKDKLERMNKNDLFIELSKYRDEVARYPNHLLTALKGEILMKVVSKKAISTELRTYAINEELRLKKTIKMRLYMKGK